MMAFGFNLMVVSIFQNCITEYLVVEVVQPLFHVLIQSDNKVHAKRSPSLVFRLFARKLNVSKTKSTTLAPRLHRTQEQTRPSLVPGQMLKLC